MPALTTKEKPEWALRLAADLLREYSERLGNDGCNDYSLPKWVPKKELLNAIRHSEDCDLEDAKASIGCNFAVCSAVADILHPQS